MRRIGASVSNSDILRNQTGVAKDHHGMKRRANQGQSDNDEFKHLHSTITRPGVSLEMAPNTIDASLQINT